MMLGKPKCHFVVCVILLLATCVATNATTLVRMELEKISETARVIVRARCVANSTNWDAGEIWTFTSFEVQEVWKGQAPPQITVRLLGGKVENLTSTVSGIPRFRPGEEIVLFLEPTRRGDFSVVSWEQGSFRVRRDRSSGRESVTQDSASFATFDPVSRRFESVGIRGLPIELLRGQVDAALNAESRRNP